MVTRSTSERSYPAGQPVGWSDVDTSHDRYIRVQGGLGVFGEDGGVIEIDETEDGKSLAVVQGLAFACSILLVLDTEAGPDSGYSRMRGSSVFASNSSEGHPDMVYAYSRDHCSVSAEVLQSTIDLSEFMPRIRKELVGHDPESEIYNAVYYTTNRATAHATGGSNWPNLKDPILVPDAFMKDVTIAKRDAMESLVSIADLARDEARAFAEQSAIRGQALNSDRTLLSVGLGQVPGIVANPLFRYGDDVVSHVDQLRQANRTAQEIEERLAESAERTFDELYAIRAALTALALAEHAAAETVA